MTKRFRGRNGSGCSFLAEGSHILWVPGHRISEYYKVIRDNRNRYWKYRFAKEKDMAEKIRVSAE